MNSSRIIYKIAALFSIGIVFDYLLSPYKVRLDPERMLIIRDDTQFATFHGNKWYAPKKHNYASVPWTCDAKRFSIDLSGTGLDLRRKLLDQSWVQSTTVIRRYKMYYVQCPRGQCIKCEPTDLFLSIDGCLTSK